jgi:GR25 family glycosyltransferase involved in LPS biosynthesis
MKVYVVSCSPPRVERLRKAAEKLNLDFVIVDSPLANDEEVLRRGKNCYRDSYASGIAATIGHIRAMEKIALESDPFAIIVEDDVRFHVNFNWYLEMCETYMNKRRSDILSIGFVNYPIISKRYYEKELLIQENVLLGNPWGAQAYIITKEYATYFSTLFSEDDLSLPYSGKFVTDCVIFDPVLNCKRSTLSHCIVIESPDEQTIAGNNNKPNLFNTVRKEWFHML